MAYLIIAIVFVATFHVMYEGIVLPSIRQHMRNKLFALRDRLRHDFINGIEKKDHEAFNLTHEAINTFANRLPMLTITAMVDIEMAISCDEKLKEKVEKRRSIIDDCQSQEIKLINQEINKILTEVVVFNTGGWLVYILPIAVVMGTWKRLVNDCKKLIAIPHRDIGRIMPNSDCCV